MQNGSENQGSGCNFKIHDLNDLNLNENNLFLVKLPKELIEYQKKGGELKLNFNKLKSGGKFKVNNCEYEGVVLKSKDFSLKSLTALFSEGDSLKTVSKFKYVIQIRKTLEVPEITPPIVEKRKIEIPESMLTYAQKRASSQISDSLLNKPAKKKKKTK